MKGNYLSLVEDGELNRRIKRATDILASCSLCPRNCGVNRLEGELGHCRTGRQAEVASFGPHFGEESCLVGSKGSGTIFFCGCNLLCRFCQNYSLSQATDPGCVEVTPTTLASIMIQLQEQGCHNINFVTPTHVVPQILESLPEAVEAGLQLPLVYNCGGYEEVDTLLLLDGIVDIYMPDAKFWDRESAKTHADCGDYPEKMRSGLLEMLRQVGDLIINERGIATSGLLVRHLLMPGAIKETEAIIDFLAQKISKDCYLNLMDQYRPCGEYASQDRNTMGKMGDTISAATYGRALELAAGAGLTRIDHRDMSALIAQLFNK